MANSFFDKLKKGMGIEATQKEESESQEEETTEERPRRPKRTAISKVPEPKRKKLPKIEKPAEEESEEEPAPPRELKIEARQEEPEEEIEIAKPAPKDLDPVEITEQKPVKKTEKSPAKESQDKEQWENFDEPTGQLAIDVYQTESDLVIQSAIAGVRADNLEISMERDVISIKGVREKPFEEEGDHFTQECYWGPFARQIIMPVEVDPDSAEASMKEGILTIRIPKILREKKRTIKVRI
ncbi:MAG: Hsp20/alpha crystallin family protein [bacterium]|nr:Hsp20/alpha crystallin family protein [bacterium]